MMMIIIISIIIFPEVGGSEQDPWVYVVHIDFDTTQILQILLRYFSRKSIFMLGE